MSTIRRLLGRLATLVRRDRAERELARELSAHLGLLEDDFAARGMSREDAVLAARRALGGVDQTKERQRDVRSFVRLEDLRRDLRYAARQLGRDRTTAVVGIVSLAVSIAAVTAVFSAVESVLLSPYPYGGVERMAVMRWTDKSGRLNPMPMSVSGFSDMLGAGALEDGVLWEAGQSALRQDGRTEAVMAGWLSPNAFAFLGVPPQLGHTFAGDVGHLSSAPENAVVLSAGYWRRRFGGSSEVLGRSLHLDGAAYTIVGVMPETFRLLDSDVYLPLQAKGGPYFSFLRLKPGVANEAAAAELSTIFQRRAEQNGAPNWRDMRVVLTDAREYATGHLTGTMTVLAGAVALLLIIGCANLSILLMSRGITRRPELTMRKALGASNGRLLRQLLTEALLCAAIAGGLGIGLAYALVPVLTNWVSLQAIPGDVHIGINAKVLAFSVVTALISGVAAGLSPGIHLSGPQVTPASRGETRGTGERRLHAVHLFAQVALTIVLLAGSAAALRTFVSLTRASLGYDPANATSLSMSLARGAFPSWAERTAYYERLRAAVATVPGVESAAISLDTLPPVVSGRSGLIIGGVNRTTDTNINLQRVSGGYFATLRMALDRGRGWTAAEDAAARHVAVVNEAFARAYFPDADPIGQHIELPGLDRRSAYSTVPPNYDRVVEVIGVAADARNAGLHDPIAAAVYVPYTLLTWDAVRIVLRASGPLATIAREAQQRIAEVNGDQVVSVTTLHERLRLAGWAREEFTAVLFLCCAVMALLLAAIGLYSVVACTVSQRRRELAVRLALGASRSQVLAAVLSTTVVTVLCGVACGLLLVGLLDATLARWTETSLWSLPSLVQAIVVLAIAGTLAVLIPARRVVSLDPMVTLRED